MCFTLVHRSTGKENESSSLSPELSSCCEGNLQKQQTPSQPHTHTAHFAWEEMMMMKKEFYKKFSQLAAKPNDHSLLQEREKVKNVLCLVVVKNQLEKGEFG